MHYSIVITSHVQLFNILFGYNKKDNLKLSRLCNSIIIIDEIQSYNNKKWIKIINFLNQYAKLLNIKIIIMSATLPKLDLLIKDNNVNFVNLIKDKDKYYQNPLFKNRVKINFNMLKDNKKNTMEEIENKLENIIQNQELIYKDKILIEFIKVKSCNEFFDKIRYKYKNYKILKLTSEVNQLYREYTIDRCKKQQKIILVSTQTIEAGTDIDMDIGLKDISILDSEEQFLGRINRSCKKQGYVFFFDLDKTSDIYKEDFRREKNLHYKEYQFYLMNKNFNEFYQLNFKRLKQKSEENGYMNYNDFLHNINNLQFEQINKDMQLIEQKSVKLFVARDIIINNKIIQGIKVWNTYKKTIFKKMDYNKKRVSLSKIKNKMNLFTYNFPIYTDKYNNEVTPQGFKEIIGNNYLIIDNTYIEPDEEGNVNTYKSLFNVNKYRESCKKCFIL